jgi:hemolysin activation/secretion protein
VATPERVPPGADTITLTLESVEVEGVHCIPAGELAAIYHNDLGKQVTLARVYGIASAMTALYRRHGYLLATVVVPAQKVTEGRIKLTAIEGFLHAVTFSGYTGSRPGLLESIRARLLADRPLRTATLEREMLLLNDLPGIQAQAILLPAASESGAADLEIRLHRAIVAGSLGFNNRGSKLQGPEQTEAALAFNSPFGLLDGTSLQYLGALPASELHLFAFSHIERLTSSGLDLTVNASHSKSEPELGVNFGQFNLETDTTQARLQLSYPFLRTRVRSLAGRLALTYHDGSTDSLGAELSNDKLAAVRIGLRWDELDSWAGVNLLDVEFSKGINGLGASRFGSLDASRPLGHPDFFKTTAYLARLQSLGGPVSLLLAANGQYATDRLLEPEEYGFGGEPFGRAYDISEFVGDSGVAAKAELRVTLEPTPRLSTTLYVFGDRGEVWRRLLPEEVDLRATEAASSAGGGLRFSWSTWLTGYVEGAKPIDHIVAARGNKDTRVFAGFEILLGP